MEINRAGEFIRQPSGYSSFKPSKLPPNPDVVYDAELMTLLSKADRFLGRLDGLTQTLPNPELFVAMYVRKEAVLSSQIEGTQASLTDVLNPEEAIEKQQAVNEVVNYVKAMNYGLNRLQKLPLSLRLLRKIHAHLLESGRGSQKNPGEFRSTQNWIGPSGCNLMNATFVPPTVPDMNAALYELEDFMQDEQDMPPLVKIALIHAQFESIHPFLDGNGRMGRLLITFWLCEKEILMQPLLYLSYYFKKNRIEYYDRLMEVRNSGNWEQWIKYFLQGIIEVSNEAVTTAKQILKLKAECENQIADKNNNYLRYMDYCFEHPYITKKNIGEAFNIAQPTAGRVVDALCDIGILEDVTPEKERYKIYAFTKYISILNVGMEP